MAYIPLFYTELSLKNLTKVNRKKIKTGNLAICPSKNFIEKILLVDRFKTTPEHTSA